MSQPSLIAPCELSVPALPRITVAILGGRHQGALAYALRVALVRPAVVLLVHARLDLPHHGGLPLDVRELDGPVGDTLVAATTLSDMFVVEVSGRCVDQRVEQLRRHTGCLLIEVDSGGGALRASGPEKSV